MAAGQADAVAVNALANLGPHQFPLAMPRGAVEGNAVTDRIEVQVEDQSVVAPDRGLPAAGRLRCEGWMTSGDDPRIATIAFS